MNCCEKHRLAFFNFDKKDATFRLVKGHELQDAAFEASHAISLEDLVGSFQCQVGV